MLDTMFNESYTAAEAASALGHGNFGDFRRNAKRDDLLVIPQREATRYEYANLFEMAVHMVIAPRHSREAAKHVAWGLFRHFQRQIVNTPAYQEQCGAILYRAGVDFGEGEDQAPDRYQMAEFLIAPSLFFGEAQISRAKDDHTISAYVLPRVVSSGDGLFTFNESGMSMKELRERATRVAGGHYISARDTYEASYEAVSIGLLDLTEIASRLEDRLSFVLQTRRVGGRAGR